VATQFVWRGTHGVKEFTFKELTTATNNFSLDRKIGQGAFATVYMGRLPDGREVAIERTLETSGIGKIDIMRELSILRSISHQHIVRVFGSCVKEKRQLLPPFRKKEEEILLVLEYIENDTLDKHLHGPRSSSPVMTSWKTRIEILLGVSRAIEYMQSYGERPVIHRDVKPSNILLDASWAPHLTDFLWALTWEGPGHQENIIGTYGYLAPECVIAGTLNPTVDVYSLGVVMLEVLTGKKPYFSKEEWEKEKTEERVEEEKREECEQEGKNTEEGKESEREEDGKTKEEWHEWRKREMFSRRHNLVSFALPLIEAGEVWKVLDKRPAAEPTPRQLEAAELVAQMAVRCLLLQWEERPPISEVVANLENALELAHCDG
ncbi:Os11g0664000, partial [Oryza sativa Japonica Group]